MRWSRNFLLISSYLCVIACSSDPAQMPTITNDAAAVVDGGVEAGVSAKPGEVTWSMLGANYTETVPASFDVIDVSQSGAAVTAAAQTNLQKPEWIAFAITLATGVTIPAGTYPCGKGVAFGVKAQGATYQANSVDGGTCTLTILEDAADKGSFRGTFVALAKNEKGGADVEITGAFNLPDMN